jgi:hypothetical protein
MCQTLEESPSINLMFQPLIQDMDWFSTDSFSFTVGLFTLLLPAIPELKSGSKVLAQVEIPKLSNLSPTQNSMSEMVTNSVSMTLFSNQWYQYAGADTTPYTAVARRTTVAGS